MKHKKYWAGLLGFCCVVMAWLFVVTHQTLPHFQSTPTPKVKGAMHIHTQLSHDSKVPQATYEHNAQTLGLSFLIFTDHNKQDILPTRHAPPYLFSYPEVSTPYGHVIAPNSHQEFTREQKSDFHVLRTMHEAGAFPVVAHPTDAKRPFTASLDDAQGIEIANMSASIRRQGAPAFLGLLPSLGVYLFNPLLALAQWYDRDTMALMHVDSFTQHHVVLFCGVDAHGLIDTEINLRAWQMFLMRAPSNASDVLQSVQSGMFYCASDLFGDMSDFDFFARINNKNDVHMGERVALQPNTSIYVRVPQLEQGVVTATLFRNGRVFQTITQPNAWVSIHEPGDYRVEVSIQVPTLYFTSRSVTVLYSNKISLFQSATP